MLPECRCSSYKGDYRTPSSRQIFGAEKAPIRHRNSQGATFGAGKHFFWHQTAPATTSGAEKAPIGHRNSQKAIFGAEKHSFWHRTAPATTSGAEKAPFGHRNSQKATFGANER